LNISDKFKSETRIAQVARVIDLCKDIIESQDDAPESVYMLKEALRTEKAKYLELHKRYHAELIRRRKLHNILQELKGNIRVMCRVRPLLYHEIKKIGDKSAGDWIQIPEECMITAANEEANKICSYEFDRVFSQKEAQDIVFEEVQPMITSAMDGYNVAILAYGQTGSGKTYTMEGQKGGNEGITFRSLHEVFEIANERIDSYKYEFALTIVEVYNEKVRNLLDKRADKLDIMEDSNGKLKVVGLTPHKISSVKDAIELFEIGKANRSVGVTNVNEYSSRSHCILTLYIKGINLELKQKVKARLDLVDLAGSERLSKSEAEGDRMKEGLAINLSLTTLGKVLNSLANKAAHVPYRDSKLTHLLKSSIGGDAKTLMIVQVSPNPGDVQESLSTLTFGARVCGIEKGKAKKNTSKIGKK